jgi:hypothetical protein
MKKAQISFEFILIFSLVFFALIGFIYLIKTRMAEINEEQDIIAMRNLANSIKSEVLLASSVNNRYLRRFEIPYKINGREYKMWINKNDELTINLFENKKVIKEYFTVFPVKVKGTFIEEITPNTTDHCITKEDYDDNRVIRISRNQVSLETDEKPVKKGEDFDVRVALNCVDNIRSIQFTVKYDPEKVEFKEVEPIDKYLKEQNPLFDDVLVSDFNNRPPLFIYETPYNYVEAGRFTYGVISEECGYGSGGIAKLTFKAIATGTTKIEFEDLFGDQSLIILDCNTNQFTKEDMPESKETTDINIID